MSIFCRKNNLVSILIISVVNSIVNGSSVNLNYFDSIIEKVNSADAKWKAGHNFDPHTPLSFLKRLMGVKKYMGPLLLKRKHNLTNDIEIPEEFDSREEWPHCPTIGQIRDQGNCGSCWAVSAAEVVSDRYCIATNGSFSLPLSDNELLSCCIVCGGGCKGGFPLVAWKYIVLFGLVTGGGYNSNIGCQPYDVEACDHHVDGGLPLCQSLPERKAPRCEDKCTNPLYNTSFDTDHHKVHSAYTIENGVAEIQRDILMHGPVEATIFVYTDFTAYKSGVYHHVTGDEMGIHAVKLLGWGVEDDTPYWLAANSWNTHWGDKGFFKILRGKNHCGIEAEIMAAIPIVN